MTQVSPAPSISGSASIRQTPPGNGGQAGFSLALVAPPAPQRPQIAPQPEHGPEAREVDAKRHAVAGPGKDLPEQDESADSEKDEPQAETAFAWFAMPLPAPPEAAPAIVAFGQPVASVELPEGEVAPLPAAALPDPATVPAGEVPASDAAPFELPQATEAPVRQIQGLDISGLARSDAPARIEIAAKIELPADSPILQTIAALQPRGESQPLAALAASAGIELPEQFRRPAPRETAITALAPQTGATEILRPHVVQSVADAQQAAIDTRRSEWMSQTIDRIEALRDSPNSRETSIRLSPDALGKVDVSIRHEGDRIHVRFTAENAQARTLLTEAQSRLTEIAEARGVKLGSASVDAGNAGQGQRQDAAPRTAPVSAPASVLGSEATTATDANLHGRVA